MALIHCPECGKEVSDLAPQCPACGYPIARMQQPPYPQVPFQAIPDPIPAPIPGYVYKMKIPGRGFGIASLVLGIIGTFYSVIFALSSLVVFADASAERYEAATGFLLGGIELLIFGILALVFGILSVRRGYQAAKSKAGIILGGITAVLCVLMIVLGALHMPTL